jgi:hypothetical protein
MNGVDSGEQPPSLFVLPENYADLIVYAMLEVDVRLDLLQEYLKENVAIGSFYFVENGRCLLLVVKNLEGMV